jgi:hypothetical protein
VPKAIRGWDGGGKTRVGEGRRGEGKGNISGGGVVVFDSSNEIRTILTDYREMGAVQAPCHKIH